MLCQKIKMPIDFSCACGIVAPCTFVRQKQKLRQLPKNIQLFALLTVCVKVIKSGTPGKAGGLKGIEPLKAV
jgi:hypothetical protein